LIGNSHDSLPDIRYRAIEPRKVSHREEINEKGEGDAVLVNDFDWRLRLHDSQPEHERREVDEREDRHFVLVGGKRRQLVVDLKDPRWKWKVTWCLIPTQENRKEIQMP
jgi:hypothetical protein